MHSTNSTSSVSADMAKIGALFREVAQALSNLVRPFIAAMGRIFERRPLPPRAAAQFAMVARGRYHGTRKRAKALRRAMRLARGAR